MTRREREILQRMAAGWRPLRMQLPNGMIERRGLVRLDWGPEGSPDAERMCWHITDKARQELAEGSVQAGDGVTGNTLIPWDPGSQTSRGGRLRLTRILNM